MIFRVSYSSCYTRGKMGRTENHGNELLAPWTLMEKTPLADSLNTLNHPQESSGKKSMAGDQYKGRQSWGGRSWAVVALTINQPVGSARAVSAGPQVGVLKPVLTSLSIHLSRRALFKDSFAAVLELNSEDYRGGRCTLRTVIFGSSVRLTVFTPGLEVLGITVSYFSVRS